VARREGCQRPVAGARARMHGGAAQSRFAR
jgi:hypothetical protein